MQGRYGIDQFTNFLVFSALIILVIEMFIKVPGIRFLFNVLSVATIFYAYFRMLSRNHNKRFSENEKYMKYRNNVKFFIARERSHMQQRKTHHIYKCPQCRQSIRVPKGKGRIAITCPKCHKEFIKRS
ncbi:MAG TPA: hypothetical protein DCZ23_01460 [Lachnospiraceae bacterium]|nr:hypothetical protein [Lachnospiraceae bacterium]